MIWTCLFSRVVFLFREPYVGEVMGLTNARTEGKRLTGAFLPYDALALSFVGPCRIGGLFFKPKENCMADCSSQRATKIHVLGVEMLTRVVAQWCKAWGEGPRDVIKMGYAPNKSRGGGGYAVARYVKGRGV